MSRQANFFSQTFPPCSSSGPSTSKLPISLSSLLAPTTVNKPTSLSDLSSRLDQAVAALSQSIEEDSSAFCSSSSDGEYTSSEEEEDDEDEMEELSTGEDFNFDSPLNTPSSSVSSIASTCSTRQLRPPLKPALRSSSSCSSNSSYSASGRKCSFSEAPPQIGRTYSSSDYARFASFILRPCLQLIDSIALDQRSER